MLSEERVLDIVAALLRCEDIPSRVRVVGEAMAYAYRKGQEDMRQRAVDLAREKIRLWKGAGCREGYSVAAGMMSEDLARLDTQEALRECEAALVRACAAAGDSSLWDAWNAKYAAALAAHDSGEELSDLIARLTKERDEAYRKGQEDMRGRAAKVCFQTRGSTIAGTRIRALKIKEAPDAE